MSDQTIGKSQKKVTGSNRKATSLETRFQVLCEEHCRLVERFNASERRLADLREAERDNTNNLFKLAKRLKEYGYLSPPDSDIPRPVPKITSNGCRIIPFKVK